MARIGLFGGSFDPVHCGHLLVGQAACDELQLDRLYFIPAAQSPFKPERALASSGERLRLLRLALAGETRYELDTQEISRGGISFTIDTVRDYVRRFPGATIYYLVGADHLPLLPKWREADQLAALAEFVVLPRPGEPVGPAPAPFRVTILKGFPLALSSSQIRERIQARLSIRNLVPAAVAEAIYNNRLYFSS